jgi:PAS domain S-box-containing protein
VSIVRNASDLFAAIVQASDDAIISKTLDGVVTSWNPGAERIFGYAAAEMIGRPITTIIPADLVHEEAEFLRRLARGEHIDHYETVRVRKDGRAINISVTLSPVHDETGVIIGISKIARDITEQKRTAALLRAQSESWRVTLASIGDGVIATDAEGRITFMNAVAETLTGWAADDARSRPLDAVFHIVNEHTRRPAENPVTRVLRGGMTVGLANHTLLVARDGHERPIDDSAAPIHDEHGRITGVVLVFRDGTKRRQAEAALRESELRFRVMADAAPVLIWMSGADKLCTWFNKTWLTFVNRSMEQELGNGWAENVHRDDFAACLTTYTTAFDARQPFSMEYRLKRHDGEYRWVLDNGIPLYDPGGAFTGYLGSCIDITDRKRAEETLKDNETRLATEADALARLNELSSRLWRLTNLSAGLDEMLAATIELVGADMGNVQLLDAVRGVLVIAAQRGFDRDFLDAFREVVAEDDSACGRALRSGQRIVVEDIEADAPYAPLRSIARAAGYRAMQSTSLVGRDGTPLGMLSTHWRSVHRPREREWHRLDLYARQAADFIERCRIDDALRAADRAKDEFLAALSHELRTPLTTMLGWARMLRTQTLDPTTTTRALEGIERSALLQQQLIEELLDVSRIVSGKLNLERHPVELGPTVEAAVEAVRANAEAKSLALDVALDPDVGVVRGDAMRLQQVVWNLLSNAIKFTPPNGRVEVRLDYRGEEAWITVRDTGEGIAPEELPLIFNRFRQADSSSRRRHGGLGLGLAIAKQLTELHGGAIDGASAGPGLGATFTVRLPLLGDAAGQQLPVRALAQGWSSGAGPLPSLSGLHVLVVDDDPSARELLTVTLHASGAQVTAAGTVREALEMLATTEQDVVLADLGMPTEDGYDLIRHMRALGRGRAQIPAGAITAYASPEDRERAIAAGYDIHLAKPVEPANLVHAVAKLAGRGYSV